ncbi:MAG TPA: VOC family protein [Thermoanaerobaculia bacterium]|nr:VOC family protein [Thermoanaerobaculia bacterium]
MAAKVNPISQEYPGATPYLCVNDAAGAIEYYKKAFGATERMRMGGPGGKIGHAEIQIGKAIIMISDEFPEMGSVSPKTLGGSPTATLLYFEDVDSIAKKAVAAGGRLARDVQDQFYGDRSGKVVDPYGHAWWIATHIEDVSPEEMEKRAMAAAGAVSG